MSPNFKWQFMTKRKSNSQLQILIKESTNNIFAYILIYLEICLPFEVRRKWKQKHITNSYSKLTVISLFAKKKKEENLFRKTRLLILSRRMGNSRLICTTIHGLKCWWWPSIIYWKLSFYQLTQDLLPSKKSSGKKLASNSIYLNYLNNQTNDKKLCQSLPIKLLPASCFWEILCLFTNAPNTVIITYTAEAYYYIIRNSFCKKQLHNIQKRKWQAFK